MEDLLLLMVALSGWCWGVLCFRALRRSRQCVIALRAGKMDVENVSVNRWRFISYLAHETRTLVSSMQGGLEIVRMGKSRYPVSHWLRLIDAMAMELSALLSTVLDRAQVDSGKLSPKLECVDLRTLVGQVADEFLPLAESRRLYVTVPPHGAIYPAVTDPVRLRQVIRNLVSNGLKFTRIGGVTISLKADLRQGLVAVLVADTGVGLTAEQRDTLFSDYAQPHTADGIAGTGLGLSISRAIARALGGDLTVDSMPGLGSTFALWVPASLAADSRLT